MRYVKCCNIEAHKCYRSIEKNEKGNDHRNKPGSEEGFGEESTLELDFKGKVEKR